MLHNFRRPWSHRPLAQREAFQVRATASDGNAFWVALVDLGDSQPKLFSITDGHASQRGTFPISDWDSMAFDVGRLHLLTSTRGVNQLFRRGDDGAWTERCAPTFEIQVIASRADGRLLISTYGTDQVFVADGEGWVGFAAITVFGRGSELFAASSPIGTYSLIISRLVSGSLD